MIDIWEYIGHPDEMGDIWRFPKLEVPPNHPFLFGIVQYKPSSYWGTHILGDLYIDMDMMVYAILRVSTNGTTPIAGCFTMGKPSTNR